MNGVRPAIIEDAKDMSKIHARTWKIAYQNYISKDYLDSIDEEGWIPMFTRAFKNNLHEAAVYELNETVTGTVTFGKSRILASCTTADNGKAVNSACSEHKCDCDTNCSDEGEIISLYVLPQYWSTKQGYELTKFAVDKLKSHGYKICYLWVIKDNERAVNFYKKFGFESTGVFTSVILAGEAVIEEKYILRL